MNASVSLASIADLADDIQAARTVELGSYVLRNPLLLYSLETAARSGAGVTVHLGDPGRAPERAANEAARRTLIAAGAHVVVEPGFGPQALHAKIAVVDGTVYLDDRNFTGEESETIIVDRRATREHDRVLTKTDALAKEAKLVRDAPGHDVLVATESLGPSPVVDALVERARRGDDVRVMYDARAGDAGCAETLERLRASGAQVRASSENHKIAVAGNAAWIGSANASPGAGEQREWAMTVGNAVAERLRHILEYCWWTAKTPLDAAHSPVYGHPGT